jgi:rod shape-determining protein MreC
LKKSYVISAVAAIAIAVLLLLLPSKPSTRLKEVGTGLFLPFFTTKKKVADSMDSLSRATKSADELRKRNLELEAEIQELRVRQQEAEEAIRQYNILADFVRFPDWERWDLVAARVIARDPANWWRTISIDVGRREQVRIGMPVVTPQGLVGRIIEVQGALSKVQLLGDEKCKVGAMLYESREAGIIQINNSNRVNPMIVDLDYLPSYSNPEQGDWVITSGLGGGLPRGIRIGQVLDSETVGYGLYKQSRVRLAVKMSSLEHVMVIRDWQDREAGDEQF